MQNIVRWRSDQFQPTHIWNPWSNETDANLEDSACTIRVLLFFPIRKFLNANIVQSKSIWVSAKAKKQALLSSTITQNVERNVTFVTSSSKKRLWQAPFCDFLRKAMFAKPLEEFQVNISFFYSERRHYKLFHKFSLDLWMSWLRSEFTEEFTEEFQVK